MNRRLFARYDWANHARFLAFLIVLVGLLATKIAFNPNPIGTSSDGSFYYQVARHVYQGDGLKTSVSLWNAGLRDLPRATHVYPLWPLVLGYAGHFLGLDFAARILPVIFYFGSLTLLYFLTLLTIRSLGDDALIRWRGVTYVDLGHFVILLFGLNPVFFRYSSLPFTEPLAYLLAFASLLLTCYAISADRLWIALVAGVLAGLAYLTKSQLAGLMLAAPAVALLRGREGIQHAVALTVGSVVVVFPWALYLRREFGPFPLYSMVNFTSFQETTQLAPYEFIRRPKGITTYVIDRLRGVKLAFGLGQWSYYRSFGAVVFLAPAAALYLFARILQYSRKSRQSMETVDPFVSALAKAVPFWVVTIAGVLVLLPVHDATSSHGGWYFGSRQGLPLILIIVSATALMSASRRWQVAPLIMILLGIFHGAAGTSAEIRNRDRIAFPHDVAKLELEAWITDQKRPPVFAAAQWIASPLGATTHGLYHEVYCDDSREQMLVYFDVLRIEYLLTSQDAEQCRFFNSVSDRLSPIAVFGSGNDRLDLWKITRYGDPSSDNARAVIKTRP